MSIEPGLLEFRTNDSMSLLHDSERGWSGSEDLARAGVDKRI